MNYKIVWSNDAANELLDIISYYKEMARIDIAKNIHTKINNKVKKLLHTPEIDIVVHLLKNIGINKYRQIIESHWIIYYQVNDKIISIVSILDKRRNLEEILYKKVIDSKIL
jgi:toxin ParE1/3/4